MRVAVMFSGGKDSLLAAKWCIDNGHDIAALISVKPRGSEAYLYHYPTVEHTPLQAEALGLEHVLLRCGVTGAKEEAEILRPIFASLNADAVALGGVGLQETQIREIGRIAAECGLATLVPHANLGSEEIVEKQIASGMEIIISDVAAGGLGKEWIGRKLDKENAEELFSLAKRHGFDASGEGGAYNTFVADAPWFSQSIELSNKRIIWDSATRSGYMEAEARAKKKITA